MVLSLRSTGMDAEKLRVTSCDARIAAVYREEAPNALQRLAIGVISWFYGYLSIQFIQRKHA